MLGRLNWYYPDAKLTLASVDYISNECCKVIDGSLILYKNYSGGGSSRTSIELQGALTDSMTRVNDFFGDLNFNRRLLTLLLRL